VSRLGIPEYDWGGNCIHGVQSRCGNGTDGKERCPTSYPNPNHLGATFNRTVWNQLGSTIGVELRSLWLQNVGENHPPTELPHIGLDCWSPVSSSFTFAQGLTVN
jgi:beta-glucosidase-like glycosyl hydrolase